MEVRGEEGTKKQRRTYISHCMELRKPKILTFTIQSFTKRIRSSEVGKNWELLLVIHLSGTRQNLEWQESRKSKFWDVSGRGTEKEQRKAREERWLPPGDSLGFLEGPTFLPLSALLS